MKKISVLLIVFVALGAFSTAFAQTKTTKHTPRPKPIGEGHETVSDKLFIPADFFKKYKLEPSDFPSANPRIKDWTNSVDKDNKYAVVNDIRWQFDKAEDAVEYQNKNLSQNSQKGVELKNKISIPGVTELHIYKEAESITALNKDMGINTMEYCFLFVVDKVVAKVWVKVNGDVKVEEASLFAREAAKTIQKAQGK